MNGVFIGGSGSIGSELIKQLVKKNTIKSIYNLDKIKLNFKHKKIKFIKTDLTKTSKFKSKLKKIDYAVILAFKINFHDLNKKKYENINNKIFKNSLEICKSHKIKKIIYASTNGVYGLTNKLTSEKTRVYPTNIYHKLKIQFEKKIIKICKQNQIKFIITRFSGIYGKTIKTNIIQKFKNIKDNNQIIQLNGDGNQKRDLLYIKDLADVLYLLIKNNKIENQILNVSYGKSETLKKICKLIGANFTIKNNRVKEQKFMLTSNKKIKRLLKWKPKYNFSKGYKDMLS